MRILTTGTTAECSIMLPLAAFPMHCYRLPNPAIYGGMATPVGATGSKVAVCP
jgi:hypothetical protein